MTDEKESVSDHVLKRLRSLERELGLEYVERDELTQDRQALIAAADHVSAHIEARDGRPRGARVSQSQWRELARQAVEALSQLAGSSRAKDALDRKALGIGEGQYALAREMVDINRENAQFSRDLAMVHLGLGVFAIDHDTDPPTLEFMLREPEEGADEPLPNVRWLPTDRLDHKDGNEVYSWQFTPPSGYNDVVIVCTPDPSSPIGMACIAEKKGVGAERTKYVLTAEEKS